MFITSLANILYNIAYASIKEIKEFFLSFSIISFEYLK